MQVKPLDQKKGKVAHALQFVDSSPKGPFTFLSRRVSHVFFNIAHDEGRNIQRHEYVSTKAALYA
jgi:hypothetical protein